MENFLFIMKAINPQTYINIWKDSQLSVFKKTLKTVVLLIPLSFLIWVFLLFRDCSNYTEEYREKERVEKLAEVEKEREEKLAQAEFNSKVDKALTQKQKEFIALIDSMRTLYLKEENQLKLTRIRKKREAELKKLLPKRNISNWKGKITSLYTDMDEKAYVEIKLHGSRNITISNNSLFEEGIKGNTKTYNNLAELEIGDLVNFSGRFMYDNLDYKDYLWEESLTESGSMEKPEFRFIFSSIDEFIPTN